MRTGLNKEGRSSPPVTWRDRVPDIPYSIVSFLTRSTLAVASAAVQGNAAIALVQFALHRQEAHP